LDQPIERSRDDEIGHLATNIESMRKDLASLIAQREHSNSEIRKLNIHLEQRVAERTVELSNALENLQAAQAELIRTEKLSALGSMVAGISHELNTPIGNGLTVASTLQDETIRFGTDMAHGLKRSRLEEFVGAVREGSGILVRSLQHAAELVSSFKQVSVDQASANRRRFDLLDMVDELLVTLGPGLRKTPYKVDTQIPTGIGMDGYPGALGQVLTNLVNNAIQHGFDGREQGKILLTAKLDGESRVLIRLEDDGIGIPIELLERVFDPFFTTKFGQGGSGIGLYIVYNLVTQILGGSIRIESTSGEGTSFILRLPRIAPEQGGTGP
jgi:signal transduction histidine kinase